MAGRLTPSFGASPDGGGDTVNTKRRVIVLVLLVALAVEPKSLAHAANGTQLGVPTTPCRSCPTEHLLNADGALNLIMTCVR